MATILRRLVLLGSLTALAPVWAMDVNTPAPLFELGGSSAPVSLSNLKGKLVYLDFWASWCGPCKQSFPWMNSLQAKYAAKGLVVLAVNVDAAREDADQFLKRVPAEFQIAYDPQGKVAKMYSLKGMPSSFLIGRDGKLVAAHTGFTAATREQVERELDAALGGQP